MHCRISIASTLLFGTIAVGCSSSLLVKEKSVVNHVEKQQRVVVVEPDNAETELAEIPASTMHPEESETLTHILRIYDEALVALGNGDFELAETKIDSAAVLSVGIDVLSLQDETLAVRYSKTLASLFQEYGRMFRDIDIINREEPLKWFDELAETGPEEFKNGQWKDDELRQVVQKIALRCDVPIDYNEDVRKSIHFFQTAKKEDMELWQRRSGRYLPYIRQVLAEENMPGDLAYLAMIESGFNPKAYSRAHCSGLWQLNEATGRFYGLKQTQWLDERRDPYTSTKVAVKYLKDLYEIYGDWRFVMAAYTGGPVGITKQFRAGITDYWSLELSRETNMYVPSFMAAVVISKAPELFGFENIEYEEPIEYDMVDVPAVKIAVAAKCAGIDTDELSDLNTALLRDQTPAGSTYSLRIPKGARERFIAELASVPVLKEPVRQRASSITYIVKSGDTLSGIAQRHNVSVKSVMDANNIRNASRLRVGQRINIPGEGAAVAVKSSSAETGSGVSSAVNTGNTSKTREYTVQRNDTLWDIAQRNKTTIARLQALNKLRGTKIIPGQTLLVPAE